MGHPLTSSPTDKTLATAAVPSGDSLFQSNRRFFFFLSVVLVIATLAIYLPVRSHPFVNFDDSGYVTTNINIQSGLDRDTLRWAFTTFREGNWHPVTWLSHALDCQLFDLNPAGHHVMNVLIHALNAWLLFWVLLRATAYVGRSFMVAALFALHPINVETVAWIAERKNVLSMLFFVLALGAYRWYARKPRVAPYLVVALLFALGLMAKPQIITFPCVLLLWDYWPLRRLFVAKSTTSLGLDSDEMLPPQTAAWLLLEKLPLFAIAGASAVITMHVQRLSGATNWYPRSVRLENAIVSYARYIGKALWPLNLAPMYPHPDSIGTLSVLGAFLLLLAITALVVERPIRPYLVVGWLWFLGMLVPMIGVVQVGGQAMADRYAYVSFIGLFIMICWGVASWATQRSLSTVWLRSVSVAALLALATLTHIQLGYWNDNATLWAHTLEITRNNFIAENSLGVALKREGKVEEAIPHFRAAVAIYPLDAASNINLADYDRQHGNLTDAIERYKKVTNFARNNRQKAEAFTGLSEAYTALGDSMRARESLRAAQELARGQ